MNLTELKAIGQAPAWLSEEGYTTLQKGYLQEAIPQFDIEAETPIGMYNRLAKAAARHYVQLGEQFANDLQRAFYEILSKAWLSPATPVATNMGAYRLNVDGKLKIKGLPVSCFGSTPGNNIAELGGIFDTSREIAALTKDGGGTSVNLANLFGMSPVTHWAKLYDMTTNIVSQGSVRRGSVALYLPIEHPDIRAFLHAKDQLRGDIREKLDCNIAVTIGDAFMERIKAGDGEALELFGQVLELRMKTGSPYICFIDNMARHVPTDYKALGLKPSASNLCVEIQLYSDIEHTFTCVLSSLNLAKYDEWATVLLPIGNYRLTVPELGIFFLDAVCEEFIQLAKDRPGFERAVRFAEKGRPLGLGVVGWHSYLQKKRLPFASPAANKFADELFGRLSRQTNVASKLLGGLLGVPEWCSVSNRRNTHTMAIAPTLANSVICNAGSAGIEPIASNAYIYGGAKGNFLRRNENLQLVFEQLGYAEAEQQKLWQNIVEHDGSVQQLSQLPEEVREIYRTAHEIDQLALLEQAAIRQKHIDQGQSLNLFIRHDAPSKDIWRLHIKAWQLGILSLYYVKSTSPHTKLPKLNTELNADRSPANWRVHMQTRSDCSYCHKAKLLLEANGLSYSEEHLPIGTVPIVRIDGKTIGGYAELKQLLEPDAKAIDAEPSCFGCD